MTSQSRREDPSGIVHTRRFWSGPARPSIVGEARRAVALFAADGGVSGDRLADVRACVSEAVTNAVVHAFRGSGAAGRVTISAAFGQDAFIIIVTDDGIGFVTRSDSPGLGLGLPTIAALADSMNVTSAARGGTEVSITFGLVKLRSP